MTSRTNYFSGIYMTEDDDTEISVGAAFGFEFVGTLLLLFTVYNVAVWAAKPLETNLEGRMTSTLAPIPIGMAVTVAHLVLGPFTGCGINPARVLGATVYEKGFFDAGSDVGGKAGDEHMFWIYIIAPLCASAVAPAIYYAMYGTVKPGAASSAKVEATKE